MVVMKKVTIDLYLDDDVFEKVRGIYETRERRKNLSYLISQIVNLSLKRLSEDDLILLLILGQKARKLEVKRQVSVLEDVVRVFAERFDEVLRSVMEDVVSCKRGNERKDGEKRGMKEGSEFDKGFSFESSGEEDEKGNGIPNISAFIL